MLEKILHPVKALEEARQIKRAQIKNELDEMLLINKQFFENPEYRNDYQTLLNYSRFRKPNNIHLTLRDYLVNRMTLGHTSEETLRLLAKSYGIKEKY